MWPGYMSIEKKKERYRDSIIVPIVLGDLVIDWQQWTQLLIDVVKASFQEPVISL